MLIKCFKPFQRVRIVKNSRDRAFIPVPGTQSEFEDWALGSRNKDSPRRVKRFESFECEHGA